MDKAPTSTDKYYRVSERDYNALVQRATLYDDLLKHARSLELQLEQVTTLLEQSRLQASTLSVQANPADGGGVPTAVAATAIEGAHEPEPPEPTNLLAPIVAATAEKTLEKLQSNHVLRAVAATTNNPTGNGSAYSQLPFDYRSMFQEALAMYERVRGKPYPGPLTAIQVAATCYGIELGMRRKSAAAAAGIPSRLWATAVAGINKQAEPYAAFGDLMDVAEAHLESIHTANWLRHATTDWRASQAFLQRRFKKDWSDEATTSIPVEELRELPDSELAKIVGTTLENLGTIGEGEILEADFESIDGD